MSKVWASSDIMKVLITNTGPWGTGSAVVAEAVLQELPHFGHQAALLFPDAQFETAEKKHDYTQLSLYYIWRFRVERDGRGLPSFPLIITDPHPRNSPRAWTFRDLSDDLLEFCFQEARREVQLAIDRFHPDLIECHHIWATADLVRELGLPCVTVAHSRGSPRPDRPRRGRKLTLKLVQKVRSAHEGKNLRLHLVEFCGAGQLGAKIGNDGGYE